MKLQHLLYLMIYVFNLSNRDTLDLVASARRSKHGQNLTYKYSKMTQTKHPIQHKHGQIKSVYCSHYISPQIY